MSVVSPPTPLAPVSAWAPLAHSVYRMLWCVWLTANVAMWMNDVAAAWMMTTLTTSPTMVALVQASSTLPVFLLGLPSGALADIVDRRRYMIATQVWVGGVALVVCAVLLADAMTAPLLLLLTFANGVGLALRWPVYSAIVPEVLPRNELPAGLALNGIAMNASRIAGPILAGLLIASVGTIYVFMLNALLAAVAGVILVRWKRQQTAATLPGEHLLGAMRVGMQYVAQSSRMQAVMLRVSVFFIQSTGLIALLPLLAKRIGHGDATTFTWLLASMGAGAICVAALMPRMRDWMNRDELIRNGTLLLATAMLVVSVAPNIFVAAPAMFFAGMAWLGVANTLSVTAQMALPNWVRARGMSIYQMAMMGSSALGAALWGQVASLTSVRNSLLIGAASGVLAMAWTSRFRLDVGEEEDLSPSDAWKAPVAARPIDPDDGPVMVTIDYLIDPARADEFKRVMQDSRRSRLRHGALEWQLFLDSANPARYTEYFIDESWVAHLRRFDRLTAADAALRERRQQFHVGEKPPVVLRRIAETLNGR